MPDSVYRLDPSRATWLLVDGEVVVMGKNNTQYMAVNGSGALLWQRLEAGASLTELAGMLCAEYGIDDALARRDVEVFLSALQARDLLTSD